jgi:RND family efflux transporter MFP subunit
MSLFGHGFGARGTVGVAAVLVAILVMGVSTLRAEARFQAPPPPPMPVAVITANYAADARIDESFAGLVAARRESSLGFERGGRIDQINVDIGDQVSAGDVLAILDTRAVAAQIAAADAQTAEAAAQTALAVETEDRQAQLLARGHISQQRFDEVATTTRAARARESAAAAAADALRVQLDLSIVTAPFDGVITLRTSDEGAIAAPGQALLHIIETNALEIRVGLPPATASGLIVGDSHSFDLGSHMLRARFRASTGVVDRQTRTVTALFDIEPGASVASGQVARLVMDRPIGAEGFWVPTAALAEGRRGLWSVYVLRADEHQAFVLEPRIVETVRIEAERVFVRGAVSDGEMILASGIQRVTPGQIVVPAIAEARAR